MSSEDPRLPVWFAAPAADLTRAAQSARRVACVLQDGLAVPPGVAPDRIERFGTGPAAGCGCCAPRDGAAQALARLHLRLARGTLAAEAVLVVAGSDAARAAMEAALQRDPLAVARFRIAEPA